MTIDFTKAEVGLKVNEPRFGNGEIKAINTMSDYPINVEFDSGYIEQFTKNGSCSVSKCILPTLRVGRYPPLEQGKIPKKKHKPLEFDGAPKWAYVSNWEDRYRVKYKRLVVAGNKDTGWLTIVDGLDNIETIRTSTWKYAWEIEE